MTGSSEEDYYIKKFDGKNFTIWKQRMMDVLVNKGLAVPLKNCKEGVCNDDQWEDLDAKARARIWLHLGESIFFTIMNKTTDFELWDSLCLAWDGKSASNKVFLMKKLMRLSMKEGSSVSSHLNEFNALYSQLTPKGLNFDDKMKAILLLCSLPTSWDTFNTAISNSKHGGKFAFGDVTSVLFTEEIRYMPHDALLALDDWYAQTWIIDSSASFHVTPHREWFATYSPMHGLVKLGDSQQLEILVIGDVKVCMVNGTQFRLKDVKHVPQLSKSLVFARQLDDLGYTTVFGNGSWLIRKANLIILKGQKFETLYPLYVFLVKENGVYVAETMPSIELWHSRLGHISHKGMNMLQHFGYLPILNYSNFSLCEHCIYGKQTKLQIAPLNRKLGQPLDLVHSDLCG
ncbi:hypothetical protein L7F22_009469 [Adiantum nelumboides]|nr:hypothetical protein [Adiantum nelumboides]